MSNLLIKTQPREIVGKKVSTLRKSDKIPAAIFGKDYPTVNVTVDTKEFTKIYSEAGHSAIVQVEVDGNKKESTLINEVQVDPSTRKFLHVSFHKINLKEEIDAEIPVVVVGEEKSQAIKEGGIVLLSTQQIQVRCLPTDLPQNIEVDIEKLGIGDSILIKDIKLPKGVVLVHSEEDAVNISVVSISEPSKEEEPVAAPVAEAAPAEEPKKEEAK